MESAKRKLLTLPESRQERFIPFSNLVTELGVNRTARASSGESAEVEVEVEGESELGDGEETSAPVPEGWRVVLRAPTLAEITRDPTTTKPTIVKTTALVTLLGSHSKPTTIMYKWEGDAAKSELRGWTIGRIASKARDPWFGLCSDERALARGCNYNVTFRRHETNGNLDGCVSLALAHSDYGANNRWVVIQRAA